MFLDDRKVLVSYLEASLIANFLYSTIGKSTKYAFLLSIRSIGFLEVKVQDLTWYSVFLSPVFIILFKNSSFSLRFRKNLQREKWSIFVSLQTLILFFEVTIAIKCYKIAPKSFQIAIVPTFYRNFYFIQAFLRFFNLKNALFFLGYVHYNLTFHTYQNNV